MHNETHNKVQRATSCYVTTTQIMDFTMINVIGNEGSRNKYMHSPFMPQIKAPRWSSFLRNANYCNGDMIPQNIPLIFSINRHWNRITELYHLAVRMEMS